MKLEKIHTIEATLRCLSGLHIGGGSSEMHIGGIDNTVIKHPITGQPYIPGSSIKGKIRSLLEWRSGQVKESPLDWEDSNNGENKAVMAILKLFGAGASGLKPETARLIGPSRLSFWDCTLSDDYVKEVLEANVLFTEDKTENCINRISASADNPRHTERVLADARFDFRLTFKVLDEGDEKLMDTVLAGLKLLEMDSLGGSGSRGYGKVRFEKLRIDGEDQSKKFAETDPFKD